MESDADHTQGGESGTAHPSAGRHWARANDLQRRANGAERANGGKPTSESTALHGEATRERAAAVKAGYQSSFKGQINIDRRGGGRSSSDSGASGPYR